MNSTVTPSTNEVNPAQPVISNYGRRKLREELDDAEITSALRQLRAALDNFLRDRSTNCQGRYLKTTSLPVLDCFERGLRHMRIVAETRDEAMRP
jgi:hypothetical protein